MTKIGAIHFFANSIGAEEDSLRLLISLLAGYPLAVFYKKIISSKNVNFQNLYFTITGIVLAYFNFGFSFIHSLVAVILNYCLLHFIGGTYLSVIISFVFNMIHLIWGYYVTMTNEYVISWTTPHCVLVLKLIGLAFDLYDGKNKRNENCDTALIQLPSIFSVFGFCYFFGGFLIGPQFSFTRYENFVSGKFFNPSTGRLPDSTKAAIFRLSAGVLYIFIFQVSSLILPDVYLLSERFANHYLLTKLVVILIWGKFVLYKYVGCWLVTEGCCILSGITYNGKDENGNILWNGCSNVHIKKFEYSYTTQILVDSFNRNTNSWVAKYVFKRLKFLGNKEISQLLSLFFLAIWHGLHTGYFMNFAFEFIMIIFERDMILIGKNNNFLKQKLSNPFCGISLFVIGKLFVQFGASYALISFVLFTPENWFWVYRQVYFLPHIVLLLWIVIKSPIKKLLLRKAQSNNTDDSYQKKEN